MLVYAALTVWSAWCRRTVGFSPFELRIKSVYICCKVFVMQNIYWLIQINQPTRCNSFSSLLLDVYVQLNMFRASSRPSTGAQQLQQQPLVLQLELGVRSAVGRGRATATNSTATAVVELLLMGVRTPETCWAVHKRQVINLRNCCIWFIYLNCMMMHGLANFKSID